MAALGQLPSSKNSGPYFRKGSEAEIQTETLLTVAVEHQHVMLKARCVLAEVRWRWSLKVLWAALRHKCLATSAQLYSQAPPLLEDETKRKVVPRTSRMRGRYVLES
jgi:hypothetical protein